MGVYTALEGRVCGECTRPQGSVILTTSENGSNGRRKKIRLLLRHVIADHFRMYGDASSVLMSSMVSADAFPW